MILNQDSDECINITALSKTYVVNGSTELILSDINLSVLERGFVSVVGPSGCGKSTLLNIIAGLDEPDGGDININGLDSDSRLGSVGYMQQKDLLLPWRSVKDNVILGLEIRGVSKRKSYQMVEPHFQSFGLSGFESNYPHTLSGGM